MDSKHTKDSKDKEQTMQDWMPDGWKDKNETLGTGNNEIIHEHRKEATLTGSHQPETVTPKRTGSKQRKESLEQYRETFYRFQNWKTANQYLSAVKPETDWMKLSANWEAGG